MSRKNNILIFVLTGILFISKIHPRNNEAGLRQIGPLFSFGQNILPAKTIRLREEPFYVKNSDRTFAFISNQIFYGITDDWVVWADFPVILKNRGFGNKKGLAGVRLETEYAYFHKVGPTRNILLTILGNIIIPSHFTNHAVPYSNGQIGGAASVLLGTTGSILTEEWYAYGSLGTQLIGKHKNKKFGNFFLYEWILGHSIYHNIYLLFEFDGFFKQKDKIFSFENPNSGGNIAYFGPSIVVASPHFYMWVGAQGAVIRKLSGNQQQPTLRAAAMFAVLF